MKCMFYFCLLSGLVNLPSEAADQFLVRNGVGQAEIVVAKDAPRTTHIAAWELQTYIKKISGAELPILNQPTNADNVKISIGESDYTRKLGITDDGLKYGAYRIVSRDNWLVMLGDDTDFVPIEPWPRSNNDIISGKMQAEWNKITGATWGYPLTQMRKHYSGRISLVGSEDEQAIDSEGNINLWGYDERGSFNAVCGYLRSLGVRWYLPGELGEVVPSIKTLPLPKIDETVTPDFDVRRFNVRFSIVNQDTMLWAMRLGMRDPYGLRVAHGMHTMTHSETILKEHPDWFALYGGKRDTKLGERLNHLCYSNPELFEETVRWARAQFDHFQFETVSIMPPDAYISICQCPLCKGKDQPERGSRGKLSNHVWDFVNRVAKEVAKTHPDKKIVCCAYGANTLPPTNIDKLEPNVQVIIVGGRRPRSNLPEQQVEVRELRESWFEKTDNLIMIFENYPFTARGWYLPAFVAKTLGESINDTKGVSRGEDIWLTFSRDFDTKDVGFNHFQVYFTARMYWGGPDQDALTMLDEYCHLFYGPAGDTMLNFFTFCEDHWQAMEKDKEKVDRALTLFEVAKSKVDPESVYAKRLGFIDEFLDSLRSKSLQLARKRGPVPKLRMVWDAEDIVIDGKLDEEYWRECPVAATCSFRELQTGREPIYDTKVMSGWRGENLYLAIRCEEQPGEPLNIGTKQNGDAALWYGDAVEILLETDSHSYYQIAVNPAGAIVDLDRGADKSAWYRWESQAEVATHIADDHWIVEIRIPVTDDDNDPLNQVIGRQPSSSLPWHINLCRQRIRDDGSEFSAFSPTGTKAFHQVMKFAHFYDGRSHKFEEDEPEDDYLFARKQGETILQSKKYEDAITHFLRLSERPGLSDFQICDALGFATEAARRQKDFTRAHELAEAVPVEAVKAVETMKNLLAERKFSELIDQYSSAKIETWPFWIRGEAYQTRGLAYFSAKQGEQAEADFQNALKFTTEERTRLNLLKTVGWNRENNLGDDAGALDAYRQVVDHERFNGSAEYYYGVQGAARLLTKQHKYEEALTVLNKIDIDKLRGSWHGSMLMSLADTLSAAGKTQEAVAVYQKVIDDPQSLKPHLDRAVDEKKRLTK